MRPPLAAEELIPGIHFSKNCPPANFEPDLRQLLFPELYGGVPTHSAAPTPAASSAAGRTNGKSAAFSAGVAGPAGDSFGKGALTSAQSHEQKIKEIKLLLPDAKGRLLPAQFFDRYQNLIHIRHLSYLRFPQERGVGEDTGQDCAFCEACNHRV